MMVELERFAIAAPDESGDAAEQLQEAIALAADRTRDLLIDEEDADPTLGDRIPEIAIVDDAGRAFTAARLQREPGTTRFTIVLTTTEDL